MKKKYSLIILALALIIFGLYRVNVYIDSINRLIQANTINNLRITDFITYSFPNELKAYNEKLKELETANQVKEAPATK